MAQLVKVTATKSGLDPQVPHGRTDSSGRPLTCTHAVQCVHLAQMCTRWNKVL